MNQARTARTPALEGAPRPADFRSQRRPFSESTRSPGSSVRSGCCSFLRGRKQDFPGEAEMVLHVV